MRLITVFGLGHIPFASGTWGSLPPVALAGLLWLVGLTPGSEHAWGSVVYHALLMLVLLVFAGACVLQGDRAEQKFGHDPAEVVADETAGQVLPLLLLPGWVFATWWQAGLALAGAFLLFRAFDVFKPWPAGRLQRVPGGWGILLDDLAAALMAMGVMQVLTRVVL